MKFKESDDFLQYDEEVRAPLRQLLRGFLKNPLFVDEFGSQSLGSRIDLAALDDQSLYGFEIKAPHDNLYRFEQQAAEYDTLFPFITLVANEKKLDKVELPDYWGMVEIADDVYWLKEPQLNPNVTSDILKFLYVDEMRRFLRRKKIKNYANWNKRKLLKTLQDLGDPVEIVLEILRRRSGNAKWCQDKGWEFNQKFAPKHRTRSAPRLTYFDGQTKSEPSTYVVDDDDV